MAGIPIPKEFQEEWRTTYIHYPDSDGEPVAESDFQLVWLFYVVQALRLFFAGRKDVYVAGNLLIYYKEGDVSACVAPDAFVVLGAENKMRRSYKLWEEPKAPDFVLEITSQSTVDKDQGTKWGLYRYLGVTEYFMFDPTADYLEPQLQGYRLREGHYEPIPLQADENGMQVIRSHVLGLDLQLVGNELRFYDPQEEETLPTYQEMNISLLAAKQAISEAEQARVEAEEKAQQEAAARQAAEARLAQLEARLRKLEEGDE